MCRVRFLAEKHPESLTMHDAEGYLPVHLAAACFSVNTKSTLELLLGQHGRDEENAPARLCGGSRRALPLHLACQAQQDPALIRLVYDAFPLASSLYDKGIQLISAFSVKYVVTVHIFNAYERCILSTRLRNSIQRLCRGTQDRR
jgi:hypothetical protein